MTDPANQPPTVTSPDRDSRQSERQSVCAYLFWLRRCLSYQLLAQGRTEPDADQGLSMAASRQTLDELLTEQAAPFRSMPTLRRDSMHYPIRGRGE